MNSKIFLGLILGLALFLRLFQLGINPPSLYWDEASLGYNAYSILTSGKDEHGEVFPLARFIAFGDFKPPLYIYTASLSILFFGLTEFAVRLPSSLAGFFMVLFTYLLCRELFFKKRISLVASFLIAVSPWSLQFSRAAFEANLGALFNLMGIYFFVLFKRRKIAIFLSVIFFIFSFYTFNSNRITAPLLLAFLFIINFKTVLKNYLWVFVSILIGIILILPSSHYLRDRESRVRFQEVSIFNDLTPVEISNQRSQREGNSPFAKVLHNRRVLFAVSFLKHFTANFDGRFLFVKGDANARLSILEMGELYPIELPLLILGVWYLALHKKKTGLIIALWMIIAVIPAATAKEVPHALRIVSILPSYQIIGAVGCMYLYHLIKYRQIKIGFFISIFISLGYVFCVYYYLHNYYFHYPQESNFAWQYGYKQMVQKVSQIENQYNRIFVTTALGRPYIYFAFYNRISNQDFLKNKVADRDWYGFWTVSKLGKYYFDFTPLQNSRQNDLIVTTPESIPGEFNVFDTIYDLEGKPVLVLADRR